MDAASPAAAPPRDCHPGIETRAVWDVDRSEGELAESESAFFAQDDFGNVWNLGEYPEEYEDGTLSGAPSTWIAGLNNAVGGIHMQGKPLVGKPEYLQGRALSIEFLDCARVVKRDAVACVPAQCFDQLLVTHERSPLDPEGGIQTKAHAPGVGIVKIGAINDPEGETLELISRVQADPVKLRTIREQARELDRRGLRSGGVYARTSPVIRD